VRHAHRAVAGPSVEPPGLPVRLGYVHLRRQGRFSYYQVTDPRVAELVLLARSLAADNATALATCMRITPGS
jgi:hypothetical protein